MLNKSIKTMDASERILAEVIKQIGNGANAPTVRDIAAAAGVSPALVLYRFGDMAGVRTAALQTARQQEENIWSRRRADYLKAPVTVSDLSGLICELLNTESERTPELAALRWLRCLHALRAGLPFESEILAQQEVQFWTDLTQQTGMSSNARRLITGFYHGLAFGHVIALRRPGFQSWSDALVHRFVARLSGASPGEADSESAFRAAASLAQDGFEEPPSGAMHATRQQILSAAIQLLMEEGVAGVTHRRLASAANASVSSVIHFFESRQSLLREAYAQMYIRLRTRSLESLANVTRPGSTLSARELADGLQPPEITFLRQTELDLAGLLNAMFEASRDPELNRLALGMFAHIGSTSRHLLMRLDGCRGHIGWLDAQILRLVTNGQMMLKYDKLIGEAGDADYDGYATALELLFGSPPLEANFQSA